MPIEIEEKILYIRRNYHLGPDRITWYLNRYHNITVSGSNDLTASLDQLSASLSYLSYSKQVYATQSLDNLNVQKPGEYYVDFNLDMFESPLHGYLTGSGDLSTSLDAGACQQYATDNGHTFITMNAGNDYEVTGCGLTSGGFMRYNTKSDSPIHI